jgi:DNA-binding CsgD family transcriptional regulator
MAQYYVFLALAPFALAGSLSALFLPRIVHTYQRFAWLRAFICMQLVLLVNNVVELLVPDPGLKQSLAAVDYLFLGSGPSAWLLFSLEYTGIVRNYRRWQALLFLLPAATCAAALAQGPSGAVWRGLEFFRDSWIVGMRTGGYGPLAVALFVYDYTLLVVGSIVLLKNAILSHKLYRRQTAWLLSGMLLPLASHFIFVMKLIPGLNKDFSAIAGAFGGFCFSIGCIRYRLFSVRPISRQTVIQQMRVGMMTVDFEGRVIDLNQAACSMLGRSEISLLGHPSKPVLAAIESRRFEIARYPLTGGEGQLEGWQIELRPRGDESPAEPPEAPAESPILSLGELRVVELLAQNLANKEISNRLGLSVSTVKFHLSNVYRKTGTRNRAELVHRISEIVNAEPSTVGDAKAD